MPAFGYTVTVTRVRPTGTDRYGNPLPGTPTRVDIVGAWAPSGGTDQVDRNRQAQRVERDFYPVSMDADIKHSDLIEIDGETWVVSDEPAAWRSPWSGARKGKVVKLIRGRG